MARTVGVIGRACPCSVAFSAENRCPPSGQARGQAFPENAPPASLGRTANAAGQLDGRFFRVVAVDDAAAIGEPKAHRGPFLSGVIEDERIVMHDLYRG